MQRQLNKDLNSPMILQNFHFQSVLSPKYAICLLEDGHSPK